MCVEERQRARERKADLDAWRTGWGWDPMASDGQRVVKDTQWRVERLVLGGTEPSIEGQAGARRVYRGRPNKQRTPPAAGAKTATTTATATTTPVGDVGAQKSGGNGGEVKK